MTHPIYPISGQGCSYFVPLDFHHWIIISMIRCWTADMTLWMFFSGMFKFKPFPTWLFFWGGNIGLNLMSFVVWIFETINVHCRRGWRGLVVIIASPEQYQHTRPDVLCWHRSCIDSLCEYFWSIRFHKNHYSPFLEHGGSGMRDVPRFNSC